MSRYRVGVFALLLAAAGGGGPAGAVAEGAQTMANTEASVPVPEPDWLPPAPPLPAARGEVVPVATVAGLLRAVHEARKGQTILVANNLQSGPPLQNQSVPPAQLAGNWTGDGTPLFAAPQVGDLHLRAAAAGIVGQADPAGAVEADFDGQERGERPGTGADQFDEAYGDGPAGGRAGAR
ncbi:MAG: hypothetical protein AB1505_07410 [Candidatus Latescibacterota bacterium]